MYYGVYSSLVLVPGDTLRLKPRNPQEGAYFSRLASTGIKGAFIPSLEGYRSKAASAVSVTRDPLVCGLQAQYSLVCTGRILVEGIQESELGCLLIEGSIMQDRPLKKSESDRELLLHRQALACLRLLFERFGLADARLTATGISASELAWLLCSSDLADTRQKAWCLARNNNLERLELLLDAAQKALVASMGTLADRHLVN